MSIREHTQQCLRYTISHVLGIQSQTLDHSIPQHISPYQIEFLLPLKPWQVPKEDSSLILEHEELYAN